MGFWSCQCSFRLCLDVDEQAAHEQRELGAVDAAIPVAVGLAHDGLRVVGCQDLGVIAGLHDDAAVHIVHYI